MQETLDEFFVAQGQDKMDFMGKDQQGGGSEHNQTQKPQNGEEGNHSKTQIACQSMPCVVPQNFLQIAEKMPETDGSVGENRNILSTISQKGMTQWGGNFWP